MEEIGKVVEVKGNVATVEIAPKGVCECCAARIVCRPGGDKMRTEALNEARAEVGQAVKVEMAPKSAIEAAVLLFILPIGFLVVGLLVFRLLGHGEPFGVLGGLLFLGLYFLALWLFDKKVAKNRRYRPVVKAVVPEETLSESGKN